MVIDRDIVCFDLIQIVYPFAGPGCSSMDGLFLENGPLQFVRNKANEVYLTDNPYSWNKAPAYVLYIDQPVGTGLSFTTSRKYPTNDEEVNVDFYYFLKQFFQLHANKFVDTSLSPSMHQRVPNPVFFSGD